MKKRSTIPVASREQGEALASPTRLEIVGLFIDDELLSVSDMAARMDVPASSLYHHVGILEDVGLLQRAGTRRKGKRDEALFELVQDLLGVPVEPGDDTSEEHARRTVAAAFRMAERDFAHALASSDTVTEGPARNAIATRMHVRASPRLLAQINEHVDALVDLLTSQSSKRVRNDDDGANDQHVSVTLALLPLKGRRPR